LKDIGEGEMNDVEEISPGKYRDVYGVPAVSKKKLRQEAIKWIEELESDNLIDKGCKECVKDGNRFIMKSDDVPLIMNEEEKDIVVEFIKHIFNISVEDLK